MKTAYKIICKFGHNMETKRNNTARKNRETSHSWAWKSRRREQYWNLERKRERRMEIDRESTALNPVGHCQVTQSDRRDNLIGKKLEGQAHSQSLPFLSLHHCSPLAGYNQGPGNMTEQGNLLIQFSFQGSVERSGEGSRRTNETDPPLFPQHLWGLLRSVLELPLAKLELCTSLPNSTFSDLTLLAWNWPWWEYLQHGNLQISQIRHIYFFLYTCMSMPWVLSL